MFMPCNYRHCEETFEVVEGARGKPKKYCSRACFRKEYYLSNKDYYSNHNKTWREENKDHRKSYMRDWQINNPDKVAENGLKRRALKMNNTLDEHFIAEDITQMLMDQDGKCAYCECDILEGYHVDHMTPLSLDGSNSWDNIALTCPSCNLSKRNKTAEEFMVGRY